MNESVDELRLKNKITVEIGDGYIESRGLLYFVCVSSFILWFPFYVFKIFSLHSLEQIRIY